MKNEYTIDETTNRIKIKLDRKNKSSIYTEVDQDKLEKLMTLNVKWYPQWIKPLQTYYVQASHYLGTNKGDQISENILFHKFILDSPEDEIIDHIDHNGLNNVSENLRISTKIQNATNRKSKNKNNKSGYRNVFWSTKDSRWLVVLQIEGRGKCFGRFKLEDVHKAGALAEEMRQKYYGDFAGKS